MIDKHFTTDQLILQKISTDNSAFILELVNTPGWLEFIGDKNIHDLDAALDYVTSIIKNEKVAYWVVYLKEKQVPIGLISLIKRDYLSHYDLGFAFMPDLIGKGYAYEATYSVLNYLINTPEYATLLAITNVSNNKSQSLLKRLGYKHQNTITEDNELLELFEVTADSFAINELYQTYF